MLRKSYVEQFFDSQRIIRYEFILQGRTINNEMYVDILYHIRDAIRWTGTEKWRKLCSFA